MNLIALLAAGALLSASPPATDTPFAFSFQEVGPPESTWTEPALMVLTRIDEDGFKRFFRERGGVLSADPAIAGQPWLEADWVDPGRAGAAGRLYDICAGQVAVRPQGMPANDDLVTTDLAGAQRRNPARFERYVFLIAMTSYVCGSYFDSTGIGSEAQGQAATRLGLDGCTAPPIDALLNRLARKPDDRARSDLVALVADGLVDSGQCQGPKNQAS